MDGLVCGQIKLYLKKTPTNRKWSVAPDPLFNTMSIFSVFILLCRVLEYTNEYSFVPASNRLIFLETRLTFDQVTFEAHDSLSLFSLPVSQALHYPLSYANWHILVSHEFSPFLPYHNLSALSAFCSTSQMTSSNNVHRRVDH